MFGVAIQRATWHSMLVAAALVAAVLVAAVLVGAVVLTWLQIWPTGG